MKFVKNFNRTTLGNTQRGLVYLKLKIFILTFFFVFFIILTVYNLNNSYFIILIVQNFYRTTLDVTQRELLVLNLKIFIFWKQILNFFYPFQHLQYK